MQVNCLLSFLILHFSINISVATDDPYGKLSSSSSPISSWLVSSQISRSNVSTDDLETLRKQVITELMEPAVDDQHIAHLIKTIRKDGTWPGINYEDTSNTGFEHRIHLDNMVNLSRAFQTPSSEYYKKPATKKVINKALEFWFENNFICENWWWNQIGTPNYMVSILLIMDDELTPEQKAKGAPIAGRANLGAWGARPGGDLIKIAGILGKYALFTRDAETLNTVIQTMASEIQFAYERGTPSDTRGLQTDFSFHHRRDRVNNTLSYGLGYANAFAEWAAKVADTQFEFPDEKIKLLVDYYLDGICKMMVYGKYPDLGARNRSITRQGSLHAHNAYIPEMLLQATDYRKDELEEIIKIRKGEIKPNLTSDQFFWHSEYFSHQRPNYFTSVRMYSTRNRSMEEPYNGEGLKNHHLGEGANFISRTGEEYFDIFPVYDWQKIPGTTVVQRPSLPAEDSIQMEGLSDFVGGVSDGTYGAATFDFKSPYDPLEARKSWFLFGKEYVCLGAGIQAETTYPVVTTLNQCYLEGDVEVMQNNTTSIIQKGSHNLNEISWVYHDSIAYLFPEPTTINLENQTAAGSWFSVNRQSDSPKDEISADIFKMWLDHGTQPQDATYAYIVVPAIGVKEVENYQQQSPIRILANSPEMQAVTHTGLHISQLVFYEAGEIQLSKDIQFNTDSPGLVMVQSEETTIKRITVADPSRKLTSMHLQVSTPVNVMGDDYEAMWNEEKGYSDITINLPQGEYAGKSVIIEF